MARREDLSTIMQQIAAAQDVQRRNAPTSAAWREASRQLRPLFEELAARQQRGERTDVAHGAR